MVRLEKLTDYGLMLLTCIAKSPQTSLRTARDLALESGLPQPTVSRLLQDLLKGGLLESQRGIRGGYRLAKAPRKISIASVIVALEGPIRLTVCSSETPGACDFESNCAIKSNQRLINKAVRSVLEQLSLADLMQPLQLLAIQDAGGRVLTTIAPASGSIQ